LCLWLSERLKSHRHEYHEYQNPYSVWIAYLVPRIKMYNLNIHRKCGSLFSMKYNFWKCKIHWMIEGECIKHKNNCPHWMEDRPWLTCEWSAQQQESGRLTRQLQGPIVIPRTQSWRVKTVVVNIKVQ
jgi:hypothetical protein